MYNKSEIMKNAWAGMKASNGMFTFAEMLKASWVQAKRKVQWEADKAAEAARQAKIEAANVARYEAMNAERKAQEARLSDTDRAEIAEIEDRLFYLNMKDSWTSDDYSTASELQAQIETIKTRSTTKCAVA